MSDVAEVLRSVNRLHERVDDMVREASLTSNTVVRTEERLIGMQTQFADHKQEVREHYEEDDARFGILNDGINSSKDRLASLESSRDKVKMIAKIFTPIAVGGSSVAATWDRIMKTLGMH